jgi:hypothetical protein
MGPLFSQKFPGVVAQVPLLKAAFDQCDSSSFLRNFSDTESASIRIVGTVHPQIIQIIGPILVFFNSHGDLGILHFKEITKYPLVI